MSNRICSPRDDNRLLFLRQNTAHIAIFDKFKTKKNKLTGEAKRQRGIIAHLVLEKNPEMRKRISIARAISKKNGNMWENIYSAIFKDIDKTLIPSGLVKEAGRLPICRGPKALQLEGIPFYDLTEDGILVAASIEELAKTTRIKILQSYFENVDDRIPDNDVMNESIILLLKTIPSFVLKIINVYVRAYTRYEIDTLTPITIDKFCSVVKQQISVEREFVQSYDALAEDQKILLKQFFKIIS